MRANIDYHFVVDWQFYSVPHALRHEQTQRATDPDNRTTVEIFHNRTRVWAHRRSSVRGGFTTRAHAEPTSSAGRVDVDGNTRLGGEARPRDAPACGRAPARAPAPGSGLPLVLRHPATGQALRRRSGRSRMLSSYRCAGSLLLACRIILKRNLDRRRRLAQSGVPTHSPRERPRPRILPLKAAYGSRVRC